MRLRITPPSWSVQMIGVTLPLALRSWVVSALSWAGEAMLSLNRITPDVQPAFSAETT